jgi:RNA recognition motif-containing protein
MDTDESSSQSKGFCFIEFDSVEAAEKAIDTFHNCIPEEFQNAEHKNYVDV